MVTKVVLDSSFRYMTCLLMTRSIDKMNDEFILLVYMQETSFPSLSCNQDHIYLLDGV